MVNLPPKPVADRDTQPFWDGVAERRLLVPRCEACGLWIWQPRPMCARCRSEEIGWVECGARARVVSWTVLHPPVLPVWRGAVPFVVLLVELSDAPGVRMLGQLVDAGGEVVGGPACADGLDFDVAVDLRWRVDEAGQTLPAWVLV